MDPRLCFLQWAGATLLFVCFYFACLFVDVFVFGVFDGHTTVNEVTVLSHLNIRWLLICIIMQLGDIHLHTGYQNTKIVCLYVSLAVHSEQQIMNRVFVFSFAFDYICL